MTAGPPSPLEAATFTEALNRRCEWAPNGVASVIVRPDSEDEIYTIAELLDRADDFAKYLATTSSPTESRSASDACGASQSDTVLICRYHSFDLHAAFVGAIFAGLVPSMVAPPSPRMEPAKYARGLAGIIEHVAPEAIITETAVVDSLAESSAALVDAASVVAATTEFQRHLPAPTDVASAAALLWDHRATERRRPHPRGDPQPGT